MKLAVVLFNMGGPDGLDAVRPFLFNLFRDPAIIPAPVFVRLPLAWRIARKRAPIARAIYEKMGGKSPLLELTREQATALEQVLSHRWDAKVFVAMRYWKPRASETVKDVKAFGPNRVVLLPLYPQFSSTTSGSSIDDWMRASRKAGLAAPTSGVCCYPIEGGFLRAQADWVRAALAEAEGFGKPRVLFSAHGLPISVIEAGDPYQWQVERTAEALAKEIGEPDLDWTLCYQSRVGPQEWIGPSTESELERAGRDKVPVVVVPVAFVSEHSETLVELDIEYREFAEKAGVPAYFRTPAVGTDPHFIDGLAQLVELAAGGGPRLNCGQAGRLCPGDRTRCSHGLALG